MKLIYIEEGSVLRRASYLAVILALGAAMAASRLPLPRVATTSLEQREAKMWTALARDAQFSEEHHLSARSRCRDIQPPLALTTPGPVLTSARSGMKVKVTFIVGADGRVRSPLILESAGSAGDRHVLQMVRTWRYRPATCDGVPTETEGKVEFSSH